MLTIQHYFSRYQLIDEETILIIFIYDYSNWFFNLINILINIMSIKTLIDGFVANHSKCPFW